MRLVNATSVGISGVSKDTTRVPPLSLTSCPIDLVPVLQSIVNAGILRHGPCPGHLLQDVMTLFCLRDLVHGNLGGKTTQQSEVGTTTLRLGGTKRTTDVPHVDNHPSPPPLRRRSPSPPRRRRSPSPTYQRYAEYSGREMHEPERYDPPARPDNRPSYGRGEMAADKEEQRARVVKPAARVEPAWERGRDVEEVVVSYMMYCSDCPLTNRSSYKLTIHSS